MKKEKRCSHLFCHGGVVSVLHAPLLGVLPHLLEVPPDLGVREVKVRLELEGGTQAVAKEASQHSAWRNTK